MRAATVTYKLDGDLLVVQQVRSLKDNAERPLSDLFADAIVHANDVRG